METVMKMPVQDRKYYIKKHNEEQEGYAKQSSKASGTETITGEALNAYAKLEQANQVNQGRL